MSPILGSRRRLLMARWFSVAITLWLVLCVIFWAWLGVVGVTVLLAICASAMLASFILLSAGYDLTGRVMIGVFGNLAITVTSFVTDPVGHLEINNVLAVLYAASVFSRRHEGQYLLLFTVWPIVSAASSMMLGGGRFVPILIDAETAMTLSRPITLISVIVGSALILIAYISLTENFERNLEKKARRAKRAEKVKSNFIANVTHELRTPLSSVLGLAGLIKEAEQDPGQRYLARNLVDVSGNLLSIVNDLLDGAKLDAGKLEVKREVVDLTEVVGGVCNTMRINAHATKVSLHLDYDCNMPRLISSDSVRLRQILLNLVSNAVKFSRPEATGRDGLVSINIKQISDDQMIFEVVDNGIGMTETALEKLFRPFQQADETISSEFGGTGLGLNIVKTLVEEMGGSVSVETELGAGSTFRVALPLIPVDAAVQEQKTTEAKCIVYHRNEQLAEIVWYYLGSGGISAKIAKTVADIEQLSQDGYDTVLVLDVHTDAMRDVVQDIRGRLPDLRIIGMTSDPEQISMTGVYQLIHSSPLVPTELWCSLIQSSDTERKSSAQSLDKSVDVLVVEDDALCRTVLVRQIETLGGTASEAESVTKAMAKIAERPFDLILLDGNLPDGTGPEVAQKIRSFFNDHDMKTPKIVAVTGLSTDAFKEDCLNAGMDGFETKPIHARRLKEILESA